MTRAAKLFDRTVCAKVVAYELQHGTHFLEAPPRRVNRIVPGGIGQAVRSFPQLLLDDAVEAFADGFIIP